MKTINFILLLLFTFLVPVRAKNIMLIGDSLTAQYFGGAMDMALKAKYGDNNVEVFGFCSASPNWYMSSTKSFTTPCGFRLQARNTNQIGDGRRATPKIKELINKYHPTTLFIQLGTNWFDELAINNSAIVSYERELDEFIKEIRSVSPSIDIIWITPPDCRKFKIPQVKVTSMIINKSKSLHFQIIDSSFLTRYADCLSDGVHYNRAGAEHWAMGVLNQLRDELFR